MFESMNLCKKYLIFNIYIYIYITYRIPKVSCSEGHHILNPILESSYPHIPVSGDLDAQMNAMLTAPVTVIEIKQALDDMVPDKVPGPDGFIARFIKTCWNIVKNDLHKIILKSQTYHKLGGNTNSAFLALIPK